MKKKSRYKPKGLRYDNMAWLMQGMLPVAKVPAAGINLQLRNYESFDEVMRGSPTKQHVDDLVGMVNMTEVLAFMNIGADWLDEILAGQDAIFNMAQRGISGQSFRFTGLEAEAIRLVLTIHDEQLKVATVAQVEKAIDHMAEYYKHKRGRRIIPKPAPAPTPSPQPEAVA